MNPFRSIWPDAMAARREDLAVGIILTALGIPAGFPTNILTDVGRSHEVQIIQVKPSS